MLILNMKNIFLPISGFEHLLYLYEIRFYIFGSTPLFLFFKSLSTKNNSNNCLTYLFYFFDKISDI